MASLNEKVVERVVAIRLEAQLFSARRSNYKRNELYRENSRAAIIRVQEGPNYYAAIRVNGQDQRHRARVLVNRRALPFRDCSN